MTSMITRHAAEVSASDARDSFTSTEGLAPRYPPDVSDAAPTRAEVTAALRALVWPPILAKLNTYGMARTRSKAAAEDLLQEAMRRLFDVEQNTRNPIVEPDPTRFLMSIMTRQISNEKTSGRLHHEPSARNKNHETAILRASERVADGSPMPERAIVARDLAERSLPALREHMADDAKGLRLLDFVTEGIETPAEQAEAMGEPMTALLTIRKRLIRAAALVARDLSGDPTTDDGDDE
jgi:DNA-directed RNA polymerase specialized sigma24 family protein